MARDLEKERSWELLNEADELADYDLDDTPDREARNELALQSIAKGVVAIGFYLRDIASSLDVIKDAQDHVASTTGYFGDPR